MYAVDYYERKGFRECDSSCLSRNAKAILMQDFPILRKIRPLIVGMRRWDKLAFAAELLELGYSLHNVRYGSELSLTTISKLRDRMKAQGMIPAEKRRVRAKLKTAGSFSAENQPRTAASEHRGVYRKGDKWRVQRRIEGRTVDYGTFETLEAAIAKSEQVFTETSH